MRRVAEPVSVQISSYRSGRHVGKAYVAMESPAVAHRVMAELSGNLLLGRPVVMMFVPIDTMEADLAEQNKRNDAAQSGEALRPIKIGGKTIHLLGTTDVYGPTPSSSDPIEDVDDE